MKAEIQKLIDNPAEMQTALNLKQLDRIIHKLTATYGQTITIKYRIRQGRSEALRGGIRTGLGQCVRNIFQGAVLLQTRHLQLMLDLYKGGRLQGLDADRTFL